jgi:hypothetical protein
MGNVSLTEIHFPRICLELSLLIYRKTERLYSKHGIGFINQT